MDIDTWKTVNTRAKSKNAAQRAKETQKQTPYQQQQKPPIQPSLPTPQPQPAKPNNKTNKRSELNLKGANKEGTDMDAFNDNNNTSVVTRMDVVNANVNSTNNNDIINANSILDTNNAIITTTPTVLTTPVNTTSSSLTTTTTTVTTNTVNNKNLIMSQIDNEVDQNKNSNNNNTNNESTTTVVPTVPTINNKSENIQNTTKTLPKSKVDVTNIFGDQQKTAKIMSNTTSSITTTTTTTPSSLTNVEQAQDETDRISLTNNDKLIQAKNEANNKAISDNNGTTLIETKSDLPYREGQWAPNNLDGKKVYDRDFLMLLRNQPASKMKPDNLPDVILADERGRISDGRYSMGRSTDFTNPPFNNFGGKSASQRGKLPQRNSQSGKVNAGGGSGGGSSGGGGGKGSRSQVIKVSISVREDVKLHEVENAWKPARFLKSDNMSEEERKTEELYRKVRGVLNKLTPQKFDTLVGQVRELQIDTTERLQGVIDLVFEKAVDEPNFSVAYALMCRELAMMQVYDKEKETNVNFRKLLITRCQMEFEKQSFDESARLEKIKEINECKDPEKKKELQFELEEYDRRIRMKSVGNIRFIGELFKQSMLTVNIMIRCLQNLLEHKDEESLECLCKLLTTIGKELEIQKKYDLSQIFGVMKDLADKKHGKISSRVRFMLQDVIDLRKNKWIPRRQDLNPKTIDQIQKEAETEQLNIQAMNSIPITPNRKDDRSGSSGGGSGSNISGTNITSNSGTGNNSGLNTERNKRRNVSDDGWQTASRSRTQPFTVQSDKLKIKAPLNDNELFGSKQLFSNWNKGSNIKNEPSSTNTANMYAALENIDTEKRPQGSRPSGKDPYSSKGPSLERSSYKQSYDGRGSSRSGSQHRSNNDNTSSQQQQSQSHHQQQKTAPAVLSSSSSLPPTTIVSSSTTTAATTEKSASVQQSSDLTVEQLERRTKNNLEEYLNDSCTIEDYNQDTQLSVPRHYLPKMVANAYFHVLERSTTARLRTGKLFAKLILLRTLKIDEYCKGLEEVLCECNELIIDIPKLWTYVAEMLVHLITEEALPLTRLYESLKILIEQGHGSLILASLFKLVVIEKGPNFLQGCWQASGLSLSDFMKTSQIDKFVKDNELEFLIGGGTSAGQSPLTYEQIYKKLLEFFRMNATFDEIVNWITANVGDRVTENKFIRTLATAIFENSIVRDKLVADTLKGHYKLLQKYADNNSNYELQCLYALQALITKLEHPQGLLLGICNRLYEDSTFSQESFIAWEQSDDPAEQKDKGVALKQLTSFFTSLKENEDEEYEGSSSSEEA